MADTKILAKDNRPTWDEYFMQMAELTAKLYLPAQTGWSSYCKGQAYCGYRI